MFEEINGLEPNSFSATECLSRAFSLLGKNYAMLLLAGLIVLVIQVVVSFIPFLSIILIILVAPLTAGLMKMGIDAADGKKLEFPTVFSGYNKFGPVIAAALLQIIPYVVLYGITMIVFSGSSSTGFLDPTVNPDGTPNFASMFAPIIFMLVLYGVAGFLISAFLFFTYHLIMDKDMGPFDAIKLSARSATSNPVQTFIMILLWGLMMIGGMIVCYVGLIFTYPIATIFGAVCYRSVFPADEPSVADEIVSPPKPDAYEGMLS